MRLADCHNIADFRTLARKRLPWPVFDYIDGAADDEITKDRNTASFADCDLVPNVLAQVAEVDMSVELFGRRLAMPLFLSPTALQRIFHPDGEIGVARAAEQFGTCFGISSLCTVALSEIGRQFPGPKMFQLYVHKDEGLNRSLVENARAADFDVLALTVDTIIGGNRERCLRSGFGSPPRITPGSFWGYASRPKWAVEFLRGGKVALPNLAGYLPEGGKPMSVADYFTQMLDQTLDWKRAEAIRVAWGDQPFCLKGIMSVADARRAIDIGATAIMISNHGGRQLDGSRAPFDQLAEIVDAVGDRLEVILDGGVRRGTHVLKALSLGAKACSGGRLYLYALAAAGEEGVVRALSLLRAELERDMKLMGASRIADLNRENLRGR